MTPRDRAAALIPAATQTYSKAPNQMPANAPRFARFAEGARVWCDDGRTYTDWTAALGPIVLGYGHPEVQQAVIVAASKGNVFGLPTEIEGEVAQQLVEMVPYAERVRFGKNGSDVTSAAVRAARALTGRDVIVSDGYHGWAGEFCPNPAGVPDVLRRLTVPLESWWDGMPVAAVIVEPDALERRDPSALSRLRARCDRAGALLIFDEVLTGFRLARGGAQEYFGVKPDLACFAKAMANGFSCSAVVGTKEAMEPFAGGVGYSMTFAGEVIGLAAARATLRVIQSEPVIDHLWRIGRLLRDGWNEIAEQLGVDLRCEGYPPRTVIRYPSLEHRTLVSQEMWQRGHMFTVGFTPTYAHTEADVDAALEAVQETLEVVASCSDPAERIEGAVVAPVFRKP